MIKKYLQKQLFEIQADKALQNYGFALTLIHLFSALFWFSRNMAADGTVCWSFFENCQTYDAFIKEWSFGNGFFFIIYAAIGFLTLGLFYRKLFGPSLAGLVILSLLKIAYQVSDYRYFGNYNYMPYMITAVYLFLPEKKTALKIFLVLFYFGAGLLKFNTDWLSGAALLEPFFIHGYLLQFACAFVIAIELVLSFFLFSRNPFVFFPVFFLFALFHVVSYWQVGWMYPATMFSLLSFFLLDRSPMVPPRSTAVFAAGALFLAAQLLPFVMAASPSLNGRWRILALTVFDAKALCQTRFFLEFKDHHIEYDPGDFHVETRLRCDPQVIFAQIQKTCQDQSQNPDFLDLSISHQVRRISSAQETETISFSRVCTRPLHSYFLGGLWQN